jgi:hypothetical protein
MARNAYGTGPANKEWGNKARKRETAQRNLNHQADAAAVDEGIEEIFADDPGPSIMDEADGDDFDYWYGVDEAWNDLYAGTADEYDDFWYDQD